MGKQHRLAFPTDGRNRARKIGGLIHTDVCGPMNIASLAGSYYFVTFRDDFTGYGVVNFMKRKSETFGHLKNYVAKLQNETGHHPSPSPRFDRTMAVNTSVLNPKHGCRPKGSATKAVARRLLNKME